MKHTKNCSEGGTCNCARDYRESWFARRFGYEIFDNIFQRWRPEASVPTFYTIAGVVIIILVLVIAIFGIGGPCP